LNLQSKNDHAKILFSLAQFADTPDIGLIGRYELRHGTVNGKLR
jgi:hypothetical protein